MNHEYTSRMLVQSRQAEFLGEARMARLAKEARQARQQAREASSPAVTPVRRGFAGQVLALLFRSA